MQIERFFDELAPRLETARVLDRELDRNLAHRFNVFDYLRTDELGLSMIIADLLDPDASHGQGGLFLRAFLEKLKGSGKGPEWPDFDGVAPITVVPEWHTERGRKVDIVVTIEGPAGTRCLAFENKPYALDQKDQVRDYLGSLKGKYGEDFLLIYLPPRGEGPSESSICGAELRKWKKHFAIMPYVAAQEEWKDEYEDFRLPHSLAIWLGECRKNCEVDRLRWFLADLVTFCQRTFGGEAMSTDYEAKAVEEFLLRDRGKWKAARVVSESRSRTLTNVCKEFLGGIKSKIEEAVEKSDVLAEFAPDIKVKDEPHKVALYRECWTRRPDPDSGRTIEIMLTPEGSLGWYFAVWFPKPKEERAALERATLVTRLESRLAGSSKKPLAWWEFAKKDWRNWDSLVPDLHEENQAHKKGQRDGQITRYFVNRFIDIAEKAVPIIDEFETGGKA